MANYAILTKRLTNTGWVITGKMTETSTVPKEVFVYENTGTTTLGKYHSVVTIPDMPRIRIWTGEAVPLSMGNYVRSPNLVLEVPAGVDVDVALSELVASLKKFVLEFNQEKESTVTYVLD